MITRTAAAWDLIRAADPAATVDVSGASDGPVAQDLLRQITADASIGSGLDEDVLTVLDVGPDQVVATRRRGLVAGLAAAAVVLVLVGTVVAVRQQHRTAALSADQQTTAAGYAKALLAELPLPRGAKRVDTPPIPELSQSPRTGNGVLDSQVAWWAVPGSFSAAVSRMSKTRSHPYWNGSITSKGIAGPRSYGWLVEVRDPAARFVSSVEVILAAHGSTVGLLARVDTHAIPVRTPEQVIPASTDAATFAFNGGGGRSYSSRLTLDISGQRVRALAQQINATPTFVVLFQASCPAPQASVTVTFSSGAHRWSLNINDVSMCSTPTLTGSNGASISLTPATALLTDVVAAAGLPSNYFVH